MVLVEVVQRVAPGPQAVAPVRIQVGQDLRTVGGHQLHPLEHGVAHQQGQPTPVRHHLVLHLGRGGI